MSHVPDRGDRVAALDHELTQGCRVVPKRERTLLPPQQVRVMVDRRDRLALIANPFPELLGDRLHALVSSPRSWWTDGGYWTRAAARAIYGSAARVERSRSRPPPEARTLS